MKRFLLTAALVGALVAPAIAQPVPQVGVTFGYVPKVTYSAVFIGLAPAAATTDLFCISGSSSKKITLQQIKVSGSAGTTLSLPITILRRASLNTGGTPAGTTANPANTISKRDLTNPTASATLISWTANPTLVDSSPTFIDSAQIAVSLTTMATVSIPVTFDWSLDAANLRQAPIIASGSTTQAICANLNGTSLASGLLTGSLTWTEE